MKTEIKGNQAFSYVEVDLDAGESIVAESDAMSSMDAALDLKAVFNGGPVKGLLRKYLGGESLFVSHFTNNTDTSRRLVLVQGTPGEVRKATLSGEALYLQPSAFMACAESVSLGLQWAGFISWFAGEGLFKLRMSGHGEVFYGAYGALIEKEISGEYVVDSSHLVAYGEDVRLKLQLAGGLFSSFFGGEGFVTRLEGSGKIIIQSRSISGLAGWLNSKFR